MKFLAMIMGALMACATGAWAQSFPAKPIRWIVPGTPGDGSDVTGRVIAERLRESWTSLWWWKTARALAVCWVQRPWPNQRPAATP